LDFNSADARTVDVGAVRQEGDILASSHGNKTLCKPATGDVSAAGCKGKDGLSGIPDDAVPREAKKHSGLVNTTNLDKGTPSSAK